MGDPDFRSGWSRRGVVLCGGLAAIALSAALLLTLSPPPDAGSAPARACDEFAAVDGKNSAKGTLRRPFRTATRLVRALRPGDTGCFRRGRYEFRVLDVDRPRITLAPYRHEAVTLQGDVKVLPRGTGSAIVDMRLNGAGGKNEIGPRIYADNALLRGNVITNHYRGICVQVSSFESQPAPKGVQINRNRIHHCGVRPSTNHHHGIYVAAAQRTSITNNWIHDNTDRGIQLYPRAQGTVVRKNIIDSNGEGVSIGGRGSSCANGNTVARNVIANSRLRWNVYSNTQGFDCSGNVVRHNCVYAGQAIGQFSLNGGIETPSRNFLAGGNRIARPAYLDRERGDLRLRPKSRCARLLQAG